MLFVFLLFALIRTLRSVPLSSDSAVDLGEAINPRDTPVDFGQRAVSDIILSCFATIFACTWSSVHPNIPPLTDSTWMRFKSQLKTMLAALLTPEIVTAWALRQYLAAKDVIVRYNDFIAKDSEKKPPSDAATVPGWRRTLLCFVQRWARSLYNTIREVFEAPLLPPTLEEGSKRPWTIAHGFLLQMGGFVLCENGVPIQVLMDDESGEESTQLLWCIQQGVIDVPRISKYEIEDRSKGNAVSKAFIILQTTWFIVQCVARWAHSLPVTELEVVTLGFAMLNGITYLLWWDKPQKVDQPFYLESKKPRQESSSDNRDPTADPGQDDRRSINTVQPRFEQPWWMFLLDRPTVRALVESRFGAVGQMMDVGRIPVEKGALWVPKYYSGIVTRDDNIWRTTSLIGILFGSVHLISCWFLDFSTPREMWLWRISAIIITLQPILFCLFTLFEDWEIVKATVAVFLVVGGILYIYARYALLVISLLALRVLPPGALQTIEWITLFPHF